MEIINENITDLVSIINETTQKIKKLIGENYTSTVKQMKETDDINIRRDLFEHFLQNSLIHDLSIKRIYGGEETVITKNYPIVVYSFEYRNTITSTLEFDYSFGQSNNYSFQKGCISNIELPDNYETFTKNWIGFS